VLVLGALAILTPRTPSPRVWTRPCRA